MMTGPEAGTILDWFNGLDEVRQDVLLSVMSDVPVETLLHYGLLIKAIRECRWSAAAFELANLVALEIETTH
jgi:hypothetical protein